MTKKKILEVVYIMLDDYELVALNYLHRNLHFSYSFQSGFCLYLDNNFNPKKSIYIIIELEKDLQFSKITSYSWYPFFSFTKSVEISITSRIEHLKRTISRLEQEIINDAAAII